MMKFIIAQFGQPSGPVGNWVGRIMARQNRERIDWAVALLDIQPVDHVLEVGFGPGVAIEQIAKLAVVGFVAGLDHSAIMVAQASKRNHAAITASRVELRLGSVTALPYDDASFDKAFAINSLQFWPDPVTNLHALGQVLKPGGCLAIVSQPRWAKSAAEVQTEGDKLARQLGAAGFIQVEQTFRTLKPMNAVCVMGKRA